MVSKFEKSSIQIPDWYQKMTIQDQHWFLSSCFCVHPHIQTVNKDRHKAPLQQLRRNFSYDLSCTTVAPAGQYEHLDWGIMEKQDAWDNFCTNALSLLGIFYRAHKEAQQSPQCGGNPCNWQQLKITNLWKNSIISNKCPPPPSLLLFFQLSYRSSLVICTPKHNRGWHNDIITNFHYHGLNWNHELCTVTRNYTTGYLLRSS